MIIDVFSQAEFDAILPDFWGTIYIKFGTQDDPAIINRSMIHATVVATGLTYVEAQKRSFVIAQADSTVIATERSVVVAERDSHVFARDKSFVKARIGSDVRIIGGEPYVISVKDKEWKDK